MGDKGCYFPSDKFLSKRLITHSSIRFLGLLFALFIIGTFPAIDFSYWNSKLFRVAIFFILISVLTWIVQSHNSFRRKLDSVTDPGDIVIYARVLSKLDFLRKKTGRIPTLFGRPEFCHWGIIVTEQLYELRVDQENGFGYFSVSPITETERGQAVLWRVVGTTAYTDVQLNAIGK